MGNKSIVEKRKNGVFYTPKILAKYLIDNLIDGSSISIFDPAYGDGALLLAAEDIFKEKSLPNSSINIYGCDINPVNGLLKHLPQANLIKGDFFEYNSPIKHELVLTNPPYVRRQNQDSVLIDEYRSLIPELKLVSKNADLWVYFLIKSFSLIKVGGSMGAVLPWAFLQAEYAIKLRIWLTENFGDIQYLALNHKYFDSTQERVVLVWLKKFGKKCESLKFAQSNNIDSNIKFINTSIKSWRYDNIVHNPQSKLDKLLAKYKRELGLEEFGKYANVKIGVVTGADKFFIRKIKEEDNLQIEEKNLIPILTTSKELPEYLIGSSNYLKRLVYLKIQDENKYMDFISSGVSGNYHLRSHSKLREPWYSVKVGDVPNAFFPYRVGKIPYLVINTLNVQCTNSIHRIYFNDLNEIQQKWIQISSLTLYCQLSIEANAKTYGRGMLKVEPSALKKALIYVSDNNSIDEIYSKIQVLLIKGAKEQAMKIATDFFNSELNIPYDIIEDSESIWLEFQRTRH